MILVDPRVGSKHLAPLFEAMGAEFDVTPLSFGDCAFIGNGPDGPVKVGIELKGGRGGADFLQSMLSGRLVGHQVEGIAEAYDRRYLIVEGVRATAQGLVWTAPRKGRQRPLFMQDIEKYLTGIEESGIRVRRTASPEHTARVIVKELYAFWSKAYEDHSSIPANVLYQTPLFQLRREDEGTARKRRVVVALKTGIGVGRSKAVAEQFDSVYAMVNAEPAEWESIEGVGKAIAGETVRAIRGEASTIRVRVPASGVSKGRGAAVRGARHSSRRQGARVGAAKRAQRRVPHARTSH